MIKEYYLTLSGVTTPRQIGPEGNGNEAVLCTPQNSSITEASPTDCLASNQDTRWVRDLASLQRWSPWILQLQATGLLSICNIEFRSVIYEA